MAAVNLKFSDSQIPSSSPHNWRNSMNVSTVNPQSTISYCELHQAQQVQQVQQVQQTQREPRITHDRLKAMKRVDTQTARKKISIGAWIEEQINDLASFVSATLFRTRNNCATRGHRVSVDNARLGSCKCADCGETITSTSQIRSGLQHAKNLAIKPVMQNPTQSGFWVDESAIDRKITNRRRKSRCWQ